jgi:hypothetical protein
LSAYLSTQLPSAPAAAKLLKGMMKKKQIGISHTHEGIGHGPRLQGRLRANIRRDKFPSHVLHLAADPSTGFFCESGNQVLILRPSTIACFLDLPALNSCDGDVLIPSPYAFLSLLHFPSLYPPCPPGLRPMPSWVWFISICFLLLHRILNCLTRSGVYKSLCAVLKGVWRAHAAAGFCARCLSGMFPHA